MLEAGDGRVHPALKELVVEASQALARLDADRLEELAISCQALNRDLKPMSARRRTKLAVQAKDAEGDMRVFSRVLHATRANLNVMSRLWEMRAGHLEYREGQTRQWEGAGGGHGDN